MKIEEFNSQKQERQILTAMVMDSTVLSKISTIWMGIDDLSSRYSNVVGQLCMDYFRKHNEAPRRGIVSLVEEHFDGVKDKETLQLVESLLSSLSDEYERDDPVSSNYLIDVAGKYFNKVRLSKTMERVKGHLDANRLDKAEEAIKSYSRAELGTASSINLFNDEEAVKSTFSQNNNEELFEYPGDVGMFFRGNASLERDSFLAICAVMKGGKSFWLIDVAWRAMLNRRRVAFFEVGDMSEGQIKMRFLCRAAHHPYRSRVWPAVVNLPTSIKRNKGSDDPPEIVYKEKTFKRPLDAGKAWAACEKVMQTEVKSKRSFFKLSVHPNFSISVEGIRNILQGWAKGGWVADVILIDYADLLAPSLGSKKDDVRDQVNNTWMRLRALSQEFHCLVVTGTQANRGAFTRNTLDRTCIGEDVRKLAHTTGVISLNVTSAEKDAGITRLGWMVLREGEFSSRNCVYTAGCLAVADPCMVSSF